MAFATSTTVDPEVTKKLQKIMQNSRKLIVQSDRGERVFVPEETLKMSFWWQVLVVCATVGCIGILFLVTTVVTTLVDLLK